MLAHAHGLPLVQTALDRFPIRCMESLYQEGAHHGFSDIRAGAADNQTRGWLCHRFKRSRSTCQVSVTVSWSDGLGQARHRRLQAAGFSDGAGVEPAPIALIGFSSRIG